MMTFILGGHFRLLSVIIYAIFKAEFSSVTCYLQVNASNTHLHLHIQEQIKEKTGVLSSNKSILGCNFSFYRGNILVEQRSFQQVHLFSVLTILYSRLISFATVAVICINMFHFTSWSLFVYGNRLNHRFGLD